MKKENINFQVFENFIKKYERALILKSKDIRITLEEAGLIVTNLTILMNNKLNELENNKNKKEEIIKINFDAGNFKQKK